MTKDEVDSLFSVALRAAHATEMNRTYGAPPHSLEVTHAEWSLVLRSDEWPADVTHLMSKCLPQCGPPAPLMLGTVGDWLALPVVITDRPTLVCMCDWSFRSAG